MLSGPLTHRQVLTVYAGVVFGMVLASLDQTIVAAALPTIVGELGGVDDLSWLVSAYLLTSTASTLVYGKLSDIYGRRPMFQIAIAIFLVGSFLCGAATDMDQLVVARGVQGLGAGGLIALGLAIMGDVLSPRERGRYQGYLAAVFAVSSVAGPVLGGFFAERLSWRWGFFVNIPVGILALGLTTVALKLPLPHQRQAIDYAGAALLVGAITAVLLVSELGGDVYGWTSAPILCLVAAALAAVGALVRQEGRAADPMLPPRLLRNRVFVLASVISFLVGAALYVAVVFVPLHLQVVSGVSPTRSALPLVPLMLGMLAASTASGQLLTRTGRYKVFLTLGSAVAAVGLVQLSMVGLTSPRWMMTAAMAVLGVGLGCVIPTLAIAVQNAVEHRDLGCATSSNPFFRSMGSAIGVALFGAVFSSRLAEELAERLPVAGRTNGLRQALDVLPGRLADLPAGAQAHATEALAASLHTVFVVAVPTCVLALLASIALREHPLRDVAPSHAVGGPL